jgi:hypothetical protein
METVKMVILPTLEVVKPVVVLAVMLLLLPTVVAEVAVPQDMEVEMVDSVEVVEELEGPQLQDLLVLLLVLVVAEEVLLLLDQAEVE